MYQHFFGLKEQAFSIAVNPRYLYMSQQHKEALAHLLYGVQEGGFVMLTGEVGTGKTTIIRCLLEQLPENTEIAIILNPMADIKELLGTICDEFGIAYESEQPSVKQLTDALQAHLLANHEEGKSTILLIDEAQLLSAEVLEQIRLLTNLETATKKLLQIILVGQPELNALLAQPRLRQLSQRITARFHLTPLTIEETERYISHRLGVAGMPEDQNPFSPAIIKQIHRFTGGIPRMINVLCERALVGAYGHNQSRINQKVFSLAKKEVTGYHPNDVVVQDQRPYVLMAVAAVAAIIVLIMTVVVMKSLFSSDPKGATISGSIARDTVEAAPPSVASTNSTMENTTELSPLIADELMSHKVLLSHLGLNTSSLSSPCSQALAESLECQTLRANTWSALEGLNRPVVLNLVTNDKFPSHAVLIGMQERSALLLDASNSRRVMSLSELGPLWTGDALYVWKKPTDFKTPLKRGDSHPAVADVAAQFALLDQKASPLSEETFNRKLEARVKLFQREHRLEPDGILGQQTLMKLNEQLALATVLERDFLASNIQ